MGFAWELQALAHAFPAMTFATIHGVYKEATLPKRITMNIGTTSSNNAVRFRGLPSLACPAAADPASALTYTDGVTSRDACAIEHLATMLEPRSERRCQAFRGAHAVVQGASEIRGPS